jgi:hypothetical protein
MEHVVTQETYEKMLRVGWKIGRDRTDAQEIADQLPRGLRITHYPDDAGKWNAGRGTFNVTDQPTMAEALAALWLKLHEALPSNNGSGVDTVTLPTEEASNGTD